MATIAVNTTEIQLLHTLLHEELSIPFPLELSNTRTNYICYIINNKIAALGKNIIFKKVDNNLYHYTVDILHITKENERAHFSHTLFDNRVLYVQQQDEEDFLQMVSETPYNFQYYLINAAELYAKEKSRIDKEEKSNQKLNKTPKFTQQQSSFLANKNISEPHMKAQYILKEIGNILELDAFIARNDQSKIYKKKLMSDNALSHFPNFNLSKELTNHLSLIDVIWFNDNQTPTAAFEIETSTSIYSGLLHMY